MADPALPGVTYTVSCAVVALLRVSLAAAYGAVSLIWPAMRISSLYVGLGLSVYLSLSLTHTHTIFYTLVRIGCAWVKWGIERTHCTADDQAWPTVVLGPRTVTSGCAAWAASCQWTVEPRRMGMPGSCQHSMTEMLLRVASAVMFSGPPCVAESTALVAAVVLVLVLVLGLVVEEVLLLVGRARPTALMATRARAVYAEGIVKVCL